MGRLCALGQLDNWSFLAPDGLAFGLGRGLSYFAMAVFRTVITPYLVNR
jgi:hypothetical protein